MPAMALDYLSSISAAMLRSGALPGASEDLTRRILRDLPSDISAYLATCKEDLPMYFTPAGPAAPAVPQRGEPGYDKYMLSHLEEVAGSLAPVAVSTTQVSGTTTSGAVPATPPPQRGTPTYDQYFLAHLAEVAGHTPA